MKLQDAISNDTDRLLEIAYFMSLRPDQLNEGIVDGVMDAAKKAGLHVGSGRGLIQILKVMGTHISKVIYYAIKANNGDAVARDRLKD